MQAEREDLESWSVSNIHKLCGCAQVHLCEKKRITADGASYEADATRPTDRAFVIYERGGAMQCDATLRLSLLLHKKYPLDNLPGGASQDRSIGSFQ